MRKVVIAASLAVIFATSLVAQRGNSPAQQVPPTAAKQSGASTETSWRTIRKTDRITDETQVALTLRATDSPASLHVGCSSDGTPQLYLAVPKTLRVNDAPLGEFRFDKREALAFTLMDVTVKSVVDELGVAPTNGVYRIGTPDETQKKDPIQMLRTASKLVYNLSLLPTTGKGSEGAFNVAGFERAAAVFAKTCGLPVR